MHLYWSGYAVVILGALSLSMDVSLGSHWAKMEWYTLNLLKFFNFHKRIANLLCT